MNALDPSLDPYPTSPDQLEPWLDKCTKIFGIAPVQLRLLSSDETTQVRASLRATGIEVSGDKKLAVTLPADPSVAAIALYVARCDHAIPGDLTMQILTRPAAAALTHRLVAEVPHSRASALGFGRPAHMAIFVANAEIIDSKLKNAGSDPTTAFVPAHDSWAATLRPPTLGPSTAIAREVGVPQIALSSLFRRGIPVELVAGSAVPPTPTEMTLGESRIEELNVAWKGHASNHVVVAWPTFLNAHGARMCAITGEAIVPPITNRPQE